MAFLMGQRAFIKLYILTIISTRQSYGLEMMEQLKQKLKLEGYTPPSSELYRGLDELVKEGIIYGVRRTKGGPDSKTDFQEIVLYRFTEDGEEKAEAYKMKLKSDLSRSLGILQLAIKDNYQ